MAKFLITSDGHKFEVTAPDQETAIKAFRYMVDRHSLPQSAGEAAPNVPSIPKAKETGADYVTQPNLSGVPAVGPILSAMGYNGVPVKKANGYEPSSVPWLDPVNSAAHGFLDAIPVVGPALNNFADRMDALTYGEKPEVRAAENAGDQSQFKDASTMGEVAGEVAPLAAVGMTSLGGKLLGVTGKTVPRVFASMGSTAAIQTADQTARGTPFLNAAWSSVIPTGIAGAVPIVGKAMSVAVEKVVAALAARQAAQEIGVSPKAAAFVQQTLGADDALSTGGLRRMSDAGAEAMLADAGPSARNTLDFAIQSSGKAGMAAREAIDARVARDGAAITDALDTTLGKPVGMDTAQASIRSASAPARKAVYDRAYAQPIDYASEDGRAIEDLLQRVPRQAIDRANLEMKIAGEKSGQIMASIADDGSVSFKTMPDVRQLDYITRALNEEAKNGIGAGAMGGQTSIGSKLSSLSADIRDTLRLSVPEYGDALAAGGDAIRQSQAVKSGYELLSPATTREDVGAWAGKLSTAERADAAQGIRSRIDDATANVTRTITDGDVPAREALKTLRELSSRANRDKVAQVIGAKKADALFAELDRATKSFELRASVADNSKTFQRHAMDRSVSAVTAPEGILATLGRGEPVNAGKRAVQMVTGLTPEHALSSRDAIMQDAVKLLTSQGETAPRIAASLGHLSARRLAAQKMAKAILIASGGAGLVAQGLALQGSQ